MVKRQIVTSIAKNGVLFTYRVNKDGKKIRVSNSFAAESKTIPVCKKTCDLRQVNLPCKKKQTVFTRAKDYRDFCKLKREKSKNAPYVRAKRKEVVERANNSLRRSLAESGKRSTKKTKVRFA
jgi:hypothetical protein